jgi:hypothetical protein
VKKEHGISGSAVAANMENDAALKEKIKALHKQFKNVWRFRKEIIRVSFGNG